MSEQAPYNPESREKREPLALKVEMDSLVCPYHPDYNEDALLGDSNRIEDELVLPPALPLTDQHHKYDKLLNTMLNAEASASAAIKERNVFGIFDGLGGGGSLVEGGSGKGRGHIASRIAAGEVSRRLAELPLDADEHETLNEMAAAFEHSRDVMTAMAENEPLFKGMGTTAIVTRFVEKPGGEIVMPFVHAGDSRVYVWDSVTHRLKQVTEDHSLLSEALKSGEITKQEFDEVNQCPDPALLKSEKLQKLYDEGNVVTSSIGAERAYAVQSGVVTGLKPGDKVLLVTDGVTDNLTDADIEQILRSGGGMREIVNDSKVKAARGIGRHKPDDITGALIEIPGKAPDTKRGLGTEDAQIDQENINRMHAIADASEQETSRFAHIERAIIAGQLGTVYDGPKTVMKMGGPDKFMKKMDSLHITALTNRIGAGRIELARDAAAGHDTSAAKAQLDAMQAELDRRIRTREETAKKTAEAELLDANDVLDDAGTEPTIVLKRPVAKKQPKPKKGKNFIERWLGL